MLKNLKFAEQDGAVLLAKADFQELVSFYLENHRGHVIQVKLDEKVEDLILNFLPPDGSA